MMHGSVAERAGVQVAGVPLVERRRAGEVFPRVPVGSVELTREQMAAAFYLRRQDVPQMPTDVRLLEVLDAALREYGVSGLDAAAAELEALPLSSRDATEAWGRAYVLCREYWYREALSQLLPSGAVALALYASDIEVSRAGRSAVGRAAEITGHVMEGVARLGARRLALLAEENPREFHPWLLVPFAELDAEYRELAPDRRRRKFCYDLSISHQINPRPLLVSFDAGGYAVGAVVPECPRTVAMVAAIRGEGAGVRL